MLQREAYMQKNFWYWKICSKSSKNSKSSNFSVMYIYSTLKQQTIGKQWRKMFEKNWNWKTYFSFLHFSFRFFISISVSVFQPWILNNFFFNLWIFLTSTWSSFTACQKTSKLFQFHFLFVEITLRNWNEFSSIFKDLIFFRTWGPSRKNSHKNHFN